MDPATAASVPAGQARRTPKLSAALGAGASTQGRGVLGGPSKTSLLGGRRPCPARGLREPGGVDQRGQRWPSGPGQTRGSLCTRAPCRPLGGRAHQAEEQTEAGAWVVTRGQGICSPCPGRPPSEGDCPRHHSAPGPEHTLGSQCWDRPLVRCSRTLYLSPHLQDRAMLTAWATLGLKSTCRPSAHVHRGSRHQGLGKLRAWGPREAPISREVRTGAAFLQECGLGPSRCPCYPRPHANSSVSP